MTANQTEWQLELPEDWEIVRLGSCFDEVRDSIIDEIGIVTVFRDGEVTLRTNRRADGYTEATDYSLYKLIQPGDLGIHNMDAFAGAIGVSDSDGMTSPVVTICRPKNHVNARYMAFVLREMARTGWIEANAKSVRERTSEFRWPMAKVQEVPLPTRETQDAIISFLDRELTQIDTLISKQQETLKLLEERKNAVMLWAVSGGLGKSKDREVVGINWMKSCPSDWMLMPLKRLSLLRSGNTITSENIRDEGDFPVFGGNGQRGFTSEFTHTGKFILIGRQGALCGNINIAEGKFWASEHAVVVNPIIDFDTDWLANLLHVMNLGQYSMTAAQPGISVELISKLKIPVPTIDEQRLIGEFLKTEIDQIQTLISRCFVFILKLQERRQSLVSAAVTGKIDVRKAA
jgi:type I restriction enzyme S subunit